MVYFKTNWIQDSNRWVIRKVRPWVFLAFGGALFFTFTYYEYLGRRVVFIRKYIDSRTDQEKQHAADNLRSRFGYKPRYEPSLEISIKKEKYSKQNLVETFNDTPRLKADQEYYKPLPSYKRFYDIESPEKSREMYFALLEHARKPGSFDYTIPVTQHSLFPDVEQEAYVTLGSKEKDSRRFCISKFSA